MKPLLTIALLLLVGVAGIYKPYFWLFSRAEFEPDWQAENEGTRCVFPDGDAQYLKPHEHCWVPGADHKSYTVYFLGEYRQFQMEDKQ